MEFRPTDRRRGISGADSMSKKFVTYSVDPEEWEELVEYINTKRQFKKPGDLARFAVSQYINRNPMKKSRRSTAPTE